MSLLDILKADYNKDTLDEWFTKNSTSLLDNLNNCLKTHIHDCKGTTQFSTLRQYFKEFKFIENGQTTFKQKKQIIDNIFTKFSQLSIPMKSNLFAYIIFLPFPQPMSIHFELSGILSRNF